MPSVSSTYTVFTIRGELGPFTKAELQAQIDAGELNPSMRVTEVETGNQLDLSAVCGPPGGGPGSNASRREGSGVKRKPAAATTLQLELEEEGPDASAPPPAPADFEDSPAMQPTSTVGTARSSSAAGGPTIRYTSPGRNEETASSGSSLRVIIGGVVLCALVAFAAIHFSGPGPTAIAKGHSIVGMWEVELTEAGFRRAGRDAAKQAPGTSAREFENALRECRLFYEFRDDQRFTMYLSTWEGTNAMGDGDYELLDVWGRRSIQFNYDTGGVEEGWHVALQNDDSLRMTLDGEHLGRMVRTEN